MGFFFFFFFLLVMGFLNQAYSSFDRLSPYTGLLFSDSYQFYIPNFIFQTEFSESQHYRNIFKEGFIWRITNDPLIIRIQIGEKEEENPWKL